MRESTIGRNYAEALLELGLRHDEAESYAAAFDALTQALGADERVRRFLETPKVEESKKLAVLRSALEGKVPERFLRFVLVVVEKRRQALLDIIRREYQSLLDEHAGRLHAEVTLARQPDEATVSLVAERLSEMLGREVVPSITVNPAILGGLVVRYGDRALDGSLRRQLVSLKRDMMNASLPKLAAGA